MKKTLLAVAVAAALPAAAFAQTNVTLSGNIKTGLSMYKLSNASTAALNGNGNALGDGSSRFIIAGTEDLGGGLKATFQVDNRLRPDEASANGNQELANGNSWVGVAGDFGQIRLGRLDQYYGLGTDAHGASATALSASNISVLSYVNGGAGIANASRTTNLIRFDSANYSGFTFGVGYSTAYAGAEGFDTAGKGNAVSVDLAYNQGPLSLGLGVWDAKNEAKTDGQKGVRIAGSYTMGAIKAGLTVDSSSRGLDANELQRVAFSIPVTVKLGPGNLIVAYTQAADAELDGKKQADTSARFFTVGYDYALSKRTSLGVSYAVLNNEKNASYALFTGAALHNIQAPVAGQDTQQLYVGLRHAF